MAKDIRWIQRFGNFKKALKQLNDGVLLSKNRELSLLEKQGVIQAFEFTHELAWKLMKDYLEYQGYQNIMGSRDAFRLAFKIGFIDKGETWMQTIQVRNTTSHVYDEKTIGDIFDAIVTQYNQIFNELLEKFEALKQSES